MTEWRLVVHPSYAIKVGAGAATSFVSTHGMDVGFGGIFRYVGVCHFSGYEILIINLLGLAGVWMESDVIHQTAEWLNALTPVRCRFDVLFAVGICSAERRLNSG